MAAAAAAARRGGSGALFTVALLWAWLGDGRDGSPNGNDAASARDAGERERGEREKDCLGSHEHKFGLIGAR